MKDNKSILEPSGMYHIYNRANGNEWLFLNDDNYIYFLKKYNEYIYPVAHTFCYCLMPNHFHFLVRIKPESEILEIIKNWKFKSTKTLQGFQTLEGLPKYQILSKFISQQFSHLFNGYTQAFNKQNNRKGSLFMHPFKRKRIDSETYLRKVIHYIHYNPVEAGFVDKVEDWKFSSFNAIVSNKPTKILKDEVVAYFDNLENFKFCHTYPPDETGIDF